MPNQLLYVDICTSVDINFMDCGQGWCLSTTLSLSCQQADKKSGGSSYGWLSLSRPWNIISNHHFCLKLYSVVWTKVLLLCQNFEQKSSTMFEPKSCFAPKMIQQMSCFTPKMFKQKSFKMFEKSFALHPLMSNLSKCLTLHPKCLNKVFLGI